MNLTTRALVVANLATATYITEWPFRLYHLVAVNLPALDRPQVIALLLLPLLIGVTVWSYLASRRTPVVRVPVPEPAWGRLPRPTTGVSGL